MTAGELLRWQWQGYPNYHRSRFNLLLHIVLVPIFIAGSILLLVALAEHSLLVGAASAIGMLASIVLQGWGHRAERVPPEPFTGPLNAIARIFLEQWITFPRFVFSGDWLRAVRAAE
jgi:hypothetical protein